jgi:hypothetical protein
MGKILRIRAQKLVGNPFIILGGERLKTPLLPLKPGKRR